MDDWRFRDIKWRQLLARQDYANWLLTGGIIIATAVVTSVAEPHVVPYVLWDGRISYPLDSSLDTIPSWVAVFAPLMMLALTIGVGEFLASRRQHRSITDAVSTALYFLADGIQSFITGLLLCQVFKYMVGRLRPNFLARCQPEVPPDLTFTLQNITQGISMSQQFPCATPEEVKEGRLAFPSGHTSVSFNLAVYASGYLIWVWHWRHPASPHRLSFAEEFRADLVNVLAKTWMLGMICFAWGVGISRIIDFQHDPSDVLGGALLGIMVALVYLLRAIPRWRRVLAADDQDQEEAEAGLPMAGGWQDGNGRAAVSSGGSEVPMVVVDRHTVGPGPLAGAPTGSGMAYTGKQSYH